MSLQTIAPGQPMQAGTLPHDTMGPTQGEGIPNPTLADLSPQAMGQWVPPSVDSGTFVGGTGSSALGDQIVAAARKYLGTPYVWGGTSASGVDCSGLVQLAYAAAGVEVPRVSYQQATYGQQVGTDQLRPGDIVAWDNNPDLPGADHVAIYIGNGQIIEAARPGTTVRVRYLSGDEGAFGVRIGG